MAGLPSWMQDSRNWLNRDPREIFVKQWVEKVISRYRRRGRLAAYQTWNEPNNPDFFDNVTLDVLTKPDNYVELLASAHSTIKRVARHKRVINAATTAIAQNFPATLDYNKAIVDAGILSFTDGYAVHYYSKSVERVLIPGGVADFLNGLNRVSGSPSRERKASFGSSNMQSGFFRSSSRTFLRYDGYTGISSPRIPRRSRRTDCITSPQASSSPICISS